MKADRVSIQIVEATTADISSASDLLREAWQEAGPGAAGFAGATDRVIEEIADPESVARLIADQDRRLFLALAGERAVGFAATRALDEANIELAGIIVRGAATGRGIGSALVDQAMEVARELGFRAMVVHTETTNRTAIRFYEGRGFTVTGTAVDDVEGVGVDVVVLEREL